MSQAHYAVCSRPGGKYVARYGNLEVAATDNPVVLREFAGRPYPPVVYFPLQDVNMELFARTARTTRCPIKGEASYYSLVDAGDAGVDIAWSYEDPMDGVAPIRGHLAFYPGRIEVRAGE